MKKYIQRLVFVFFACGLMLGLGACTSGGYYGSPSTVYVGGVGHHHGYGPGWGHGWHGGYRPGRPIGPPPGMGRPPSSRPPSARPPGAGRPQPMPRRR